MINKETAYTNPSRSIPFISGQLKVILTVICFRILVNTTNDMMDSDKNEPISEPVTPNGIGPMRRNVNTQLINAGNQLIRLNSLIFCLPKKIPELYVLYNENGMAI